VVVSGFATGIGFTSGGSGSGACIGFASVVSGFTTGFAAIVVSGSGSGAGKG
jgi:hypothetical protein